MLLYCGGDYHVSGAMLTNNYIVAGDDPKHKHLATLPHPDNVRQCWPTKLANIMKASLLLGPTHLGARQIVDETMRWVETSPEHNARKVAIIQWPITSPSDHDRVWRLHETMKNLGIRHIFYNTDRAFFRVRHHKMWGDSFIEPYNRNRAYIATMMARGFQTVMPDVEYYGKDAHDYWTKYLLTCLQARGMV